METTTLMPKEAYDILQEANDKLRATVSKIIPRKCIADPMGWYSQTPDMTSLYTALAGSFSIPRSDRELTTLGGESAGLLFQRLATKYVNTYLMHPNPVTRYLNSRLHEHSRLLPDEPTLELMKRLYPDTEVTHPNTPFEALNKVGVSDGLVLEPNPTNKGGVVKAVCEMTSINDQNGNDKNYYENKFKGFLDLRSAYPILFGDDSFLLFVVPRNTWPAIRREMLPNIEFMELPFNREQLREYTHTLISDYRPSNQQPTLAERQERARFQYNRTLDRILELPKNPAQLERIPPDYLESLLTYIQNNSSNSPWRGSRSLARV